MRRIILVCVAVAGLLVASCSKNNEHRPDDTLTVSILPQKILLQEILGDSAEYTINCLFEDAGNPETFDPSVSDLKATASSVVYFTLGTLPFETEVISRLREGGNQIPVVNTSQSIKLLYGTHGDNEPDPHIWLTPGNAKQMARTMAAELKRINPTQAHRYDANLQRLEQRLDSVDALNRKITAQKTGRAFMVLHPSVSYPAKEYGLTQIPLNGFEGKEISVAETRQRIEKARNSGATVMVIESEADRQRAKTLIKESNTPIEIIVYNPMGNDWLEQFTKLAGKICN